jgi:hypothetical protein
MAEKTVNQNMSDDEIASLIIGFIKEIKKKPGYGDVLIGIRNGKVITIKPAPVYNIGANKKN